MNRTLAMQELPTTYADILRWRDAGDSDCDIAARLGIQPASVSLLVRLGEAKLVPLLGDDTGAAEP